MGRKEVKSYIITVTLNSREGLDRFLREGKIRKGKTILIKEVKDGVLITDEYKKTI